MDILANEGPPHQAFIKLLLRQVQKCSFKKLNTLNKLPRLTRRNAPHNLAFHFYKQFARVNGKNLSHNRDSSCPTIETNSLKLEGFGNGCKGWH